MTALLTAPLLAAAVLVPLSLFSLLSACPAYRGQGSPQGLTEHSSPFEAFVIVTEGAATLTIGGTPVRATPGTIVRMPANVPHAVDAVERTRLLLVMLRD